MIFAYLLLSSTDCRAGHHPGHRMITAPRRLFGGDPLGGDKVFRHQAHLSQPLLQVRVRVEQKNTRVLFHLGVGHLPEVPVESANVDTFTRSCGSG
jgi:hypothetical protein